MEKKATIGMGKISEVTARLRLNPDAVAYVISEENRAAFPEDVRDRVHVDTRENMLRRW